MVGTMYRQPLFSVVTLFISSGSRLKSNTYKDNDAIPRINTGEHIQLY